MKIEEEVDTYVEQDKSEEFKKEDPCPTSLILSVTEGKKFWLIDNSGAECTVHIMEFSHAKKRVKVRITAPTSTRIIREK